MRTKPTTGRGMRRDEKSPRAGGLLWGLVFYFEREDALYTKRFIPSRGWRGHRPARRMGGASPFVRSA